MSEAARRAMASTLRTNLGTWTQVQTRFGPLLVAAVDGAIVQTALPNVEPQQFLAELASRYPGVDFLQDNRDPLLQRAATQLREYSEGLRMTFDLPVRLDGTPFQEKVWAALARIPYGSALSYQDIALSVGKPGGSRAVGQANHRNPVPIIVPCHRVITADGRLGGFGGGMRLKRRLLEHEGVAVDGSEED